jgi:signal transduction histidine kinase/ligand-binding sensor domain-containing protein
VLVPNRSSIPSFFRLPAALFLAISPAFSQVAVDHWTADNGLPQNVIRAICQTPDGYLWLATFDGLVRFDGVRFVTYNRANTPGIESNRFSALYCTPDGDLWAATEGSGLTQYRHGTFRTYNLKDGLLSSHVEGLSSDNRGNIWALSDGMVHRWQPEERRFIPMGDEYRYSYWLTPDGLTGFWRIDKDSIYLFVRGERSRYPLPAGWPLDPATATFDFNGHLWLSTTDGTFARMVDGRWLGVFQARRGKSGFPLKTSDMTEYRDSQANVWKIGMEWIGSGVGQYMSLPTGSRPEKIRFTSLFEDREGSIWLATDGSGLFRLRTQTIQTYSKEHGLPDGNVYPIFEAHDGALWIGTWFGGLCRFEAGKCRNYSIADGLASNRVYSIFEDRDHVMWVSVEHGLYRLRNGRFEAVAGHGMTTGDLLVRAIQQDPQGAMWFGTAQGVFRLEHGKWTFLTSRDGLATNDARIILNGRDGNLWIGGYGGLTSLQAGQVKAWTEQDGLPGNMVRSLYEDRDGVLWIGTYDAGLGRLENGKFTRVAVADGLFNNGVFQVLEDARSNLWMSSNRGIYRVAKQQLNDFAAGKTRSVTAIPYGQRDGMRNIECNGGLMPAGVRSRDGRLWFPTQDGVVMIDPEKMAAPPEPPPVKIESSRIDGVPASTGGALWVSPGSESFEIQYTALSFLDPERTQFRYRLEGLDRDWVAAGTRRSAYYPHVPPGSYTFRVTAAHGDGIWNERGAILSVVVLPPFYRTWWFSSLAFIAAASVLWLAWRRRLAGVERARLAQQAFSRQLIASQEAERKRIATELHDSLGQSLVVIKNIALLFANERNGDSAGVRQMDEISAESSRAIEEVRQISYNLRPYQLDRLGLRNAVLALVKIASKATPARLEADVDELDGFFAKDDEINFYRIVQECLNNVVKHSEATEIQVSIKRQPGALSFGIRDNGRGFTPGSAPVDPMRGGFGLVGIRERAELLGGKAWIQTAPGKGTTVNIHIEAGNMKNAR